MLPPNYNDNDDIIKQYQKINRFLIDDVGYVGIEHQMNIQRRKWSQKTNIWEHTFESCFSYIER